MQPRVDELRIRLEGQLEVVEAATASYRRATQVLRREDWASESSWWSVDHEDTSRAAEALTRLAPDDALLTAFTREREALRKISQARLAQLGVTPPPGVEALEDTLRRLRGARPLLTGTMREVEVEVRLHGVTQFFIALLAAVLLLGACTLALPFLGWWALFPSALALGSPLAWSLLRNVRRRGPRFTLSAQDLFLRDERLRLPLDQVHATMVAERDGWEVTWHFAHRRSLHTRLSEAEATRVRSVLGSQVRVVAAPTT